jgi:hypothetical protein
MCLRRGRDGKVWSWLVDRTLMRLVGSEVTIKISLE